MFYRLYIDGTKRDVLIKAKNAVIASSVVSESMAYHEINFNEFQIFPVESSSDISEEELNMCVIWGWYEE